MRNLAGSEDADRHILQELRRAGIPAAMCESSKGEVPYNYAGHLGEIEFHRAWTYWVVNGSVPLALAERLYADPVGVTDVRVAGHCGCPAPVDPWVTRRTRDGEEFVSVDLYHIDTEIGLRVFADALRSSVPVEDPTT